MSSQKTTNNRILSIDSMRLFAALLVVSIHCWRYWGRDIVVPYARIAVPIFFLISGYFLYSNKQQIVNERINRNLKKIAIIWIIGTISFCIDSYIKCKIKNDYSVFFPTWQTPILWAVFCHQKIGFPLWFLIALAEGLFAMKLMIKRGWEKVLTSYWQWLTPCILLTIGVLLNKYLCFYHPIWNNSDLQYPPVLFMSWPYLYLGFLIKNKQTELLALFSSRQYLLWIGAMVTLVLTYFEGLYAPKNGDSYICTLPLVLPIFILLILHPTSGGQNMALLGRKYSLWIYIFHVIVYSFIQRQLGTYHHWLLHPITIFSITALLTPIIDWAANHIVFKRM